MPNHKVTVILLPGESGRYQVFVPYFQNCTTDADSVEDALENAKEALEGILEDATDLELEALEYSYYPIVVVGEVKIKVPVKPKVEATA